MVPSINNICGTYAFLEKKGCYSGHYILLVETPVKCVQTGSMDPHLMICVIGNLNYHFTTNEIVATHRQLQINFARKIKSIKSDQSGRAGPL